MDRVFSVGIILPPPEFFAEPIVRGIGGYSASHDRWRITVSIGRGSRSMKRFLDTCDGVIAHGDKSLVQPLVQCGRPCVAYLAKPAEFAFTGIPVVMPDEQGIGARGAEHLLSLGFRRFGFYGADAEFSQDRERGFMQRLAKASFDCHVTAPSNSPDRHPSWEKLSDPRFVLRWVKQFKPPAAVMALNDLMAREVIEACQRAGWRVPEDVAVLGVDNNELLCNYSDVPLSSVDRNLERLGFESAALLDRLIHRKASKDEVVVVPPGPLVVRRSTAALAIHDPEAAAAVRFIQEHACTGIDVDDVLAVVPVSRRALERKLQKAIGRTPAQEIRRVRLARVCELLTATDLPLSDIVPRSGFQHRAYLAKVFKETFDRTPRQFRIENRAVSHRG